MLIGFWFLDFEEEFDIVRSWVKPATARLQLVFTGFANAIGTIDYVYSVGRVGIVSLTVFYKVE